MAKTKIRWNIIVSESTDRKVRKYLARAGDKKGNLSQFVERTVRQAVSQAVFWENIDEIWERNKRLSAEEAQALADEAVAEARASRS